MEIGRNRSESRLKKQLVKVGGVEHFIMWILKLGGQEVRLQTGRGVWIVVRTTGAIGVNSAKEKAGQSGRKSVKSGS